jgi:hypothetical protein
MKVNIRVSMMPLLMCAILAAAGCDRASYEPPMTDADIGQFPDSAMSESLMRASGISVQRERNPYLAYEHSISIEVDEENLEASFLNTIAKCLGDKANGCEVHYSELRTGDYPSADIRVRIKKDGVEPLIRTAAENNKVSEQTMSTEDLAAPILDSEKRQKLLESYQKRLIELESQSAKDIDSLIKVASEIARVQSDLETAKGDNAHLLKRINMDMVSFHFHTDPQAAIVEPISTAMKSFARNLSEGIASIFTLIAFVLPWVLVLTGLFYAWRWWRKRKK